MKQFNKQTIVVLALIVTANGCRTADGTRWRGLSLLGRKPEISADAQTIANTELPPPSAAALPGKPLLGKAKALTADATKSVANTVQNATGRVRKATTEVVEKAKPYPATTYPKFQANAAETSTPKVNIPKGLTASSMPTPNIPNLRAPDIAIKQPPTQVALPEVPSSIRTASANLNVATTSPPLATTTAAGTNYATGPYSTSAIAIPSQTLQQQTDTVSNVQQGYYNPQDTPTTSSRRSTIPSENAPNYQIPDMPAQDTSSSMQYAPSYQQANNYQPPGYQAPNYQAPNYQAPSHSSANHSAASYPETSTPQYPTTGAGTISQVSAAAPIGAPPTNAVSPATHYVPSAGIYAPSNPTPPDSFYSQPAKPSNWRPGSTSQGSLVSATNAEPGCSNGVCAIPTTATQPYPTQPTTYQQPAYQQPATIHSPAAYQPSTTHATYETATQPQAVSGARESTWR